ncbi:helix-turn-helix domain-containing protein [Streptomyces sp. TLI_146]|uniref:helix-turn-helix domain-containing protein n=1 Tax=Streptomyces sp. TLI_146 TaxID=1938858 RepID=UPI000C6FCD7F|nr:helix-turn-helix domain-containing protein [Streptomyces sp. TLI_146]PKV77057.1 helix-turn-helix protein [Streptomyces sp. TLI_146]
MAQDVFERVDALVARSAGLPPPHVRARLRQAGRLTQAEVAEALGVHRVQVVRWEGGKAEPRQPHRLLYARLLCGLAEKYPEAACQAGAVPAALDPAPDPP